MVHAILEESELVAATPSFMFLGTDVGELCPTTMGWRSFLRFVPRRGFQLVPNYLPLSKSCYHDDEKSWCEEQGTRFYKHSRDASPGGQVTHRWKIIAHGKFVVKKTERYFAQKKNPILSIYRLMFVRNLFRVVGKRQDYAMSMYKITEDAENQLKRSP